jgi:hypothetical protein
MLLRLTRCSPESSGSISGALFRPPSCEPCMRLSTHTALQFPVFSWVGMPHLAYHPRSLRYSLFPFPMSRALPRSLEYYGNSVAMSLSTGRRSRLCAHRRWSVFRLRVRLLPPFVTGYSPERAFASQCINTGYFPHPSTTCGIGVLPRELCCGRPFVWPLEAEIQPIQA